MTQQQPLAIGVSLKMYFGHQQTLDWVRTVSDSAARHPAITGGAVELFIVPGFPALVESVDLLADTNVEVGAQDLFWEDTGAFTGEVSGSELAEIGCTLVEIGHAERRRLFGETDSIIARKTLAAYRNGLTPLLCIGEPLKQSPEDAAEECLRQVDAALADTRAAGLTGRLLLAYEPQWAIGAAEPANATYIVEVVTALRSSLLADASLAGNRVIYGGSAGPGLLGQLEGAVDGLFLGRFAHNPAALEAILDEALTLAAEGVPA
jgi:triosephosphate isomerase